MMKEAITRESRRLAGALRGLETHLGGADENELPATTLARTLLWLTEASDRLEGINDELAGLSETPDAPAF